MADIKPKIGDYVYVGVFEKGKSLAKVIAGVDAEGDYYLYCEDNIDTDFDINVSRLNHEYEGESYKDYLIKSGIEVSDEFSDDEYDAGRYYSPEQILGYAFVLDNPIARKVYKNQIDKIEGGKIYLKA